MLQKLSLVQLYNFQLSCNDCKVVSYPTFSLKQTHCLPVWYGDEKRSFLFIHKLKKKTIKSSRYQHVELTTSKGALATDLDTIQHKL